MCVIFVAVRLYSNRSQKTSKCDSKVLTKLDGNKIEVFVSDDQKSRELRRIPTTCSSVYLYDVVNKYT